MPQQLAIARICLAACLGPVFIGSPVSAQEIADTIYRGGPILTIDDNGPTAEAVAVRDGRILAVGTLSDVAAHQ